MNIRGEGNSLFSSHIGMEQIHVWGNGEDAFSISQTATASVIHGSAGENGRHGIVVSSSKYVWLWNMDITRFAGENVCGVAIRDNSQDILVQGIKIQDTEGPIMAGICARNSSGIIVKDGVIVPYPDDATAVCYHLRSLTGFEAAENYCGLSDGDNVDTDGSVVVPTAIAVPPPKEKRKELVAFSSPTPTPDPSFRYIVIDVLPPTPTPSYFKNTLKISSRPSST